MKEIWEHHKGGKYMLLERSNVRSTSAGWVDTMTYACCLSGFVYSRAHSEFIKKFKRVN